MPQPVLAILSLTKFRKRFTNGWDTHVSLTFLTDTYCAYKNGSSAALQHALSVKDSERILTTAKPLSTDGELELIFNEWHQAWQRLLPLIWEFIPDEYEGWKIHYTTILLK